MAKPINDEDGIRSGFEDYKWTSSHEKTKILIVKDEEWPFYRVTDVPPNYFPPIMGETTVEVPIEVYEKWKKVMEEFGEIQKEIEKYYQQGE